MSEDDKKETPIGVLILLSLALPGAGQLALGQTTKGVITMVISAILLVDITVHAFIIAAPLAGAMLAGMEPVIDERTLEPLRFLLKVVAVAFAILVWALIDTIIAARRRDSEKQKPLA